ncbi:MAG: hypothetical protein V9G24_18810 [Rhodoblastus sp.]
MASAAASAFSVSNEKALAGPNFSSAAAAGASGKAAARLAAPAAPRTLRRSISLMAFPESKGARPPAVKLAARACPFKLSRVQVGD